MNDQTAMERERQAILKAIDSMEKSGETSALIKADVRAKRIKETLQDWDDFRLRLVSRLIFGG